MKFAMAGLVILIVAFVAVVVIVLRNRNQDEYEDEGFDDNQSPFADSDDNMVQSSQIAHNSGMNAPQQHAQSRDTLKISQNYIEQQRYDEAESELKKGIRIEPENNIFYLKLLNLYALTNNHQEFQNVFAQIIANGDIDAIKQAEQLKSMVDAEQTSIASTKAPELSPEVDNDGFIDFNIGDDTSTDSLNTPVNNTSEMNVDEPFGNLEDSLLEGSNNDFSNAVSSSDESSLDFDLSMDNIDTSSNLQESNNTGSDAEISFDISEPSNVSLDNSLSLDNDVLGAELHTTQEVAQENIADDTLSNNSGLELNDFNFDDESLKPEQNIADISETTIAPIDKPEVNEVSNDDFDFDFDFDEKPATNSDEQSLDELAMGMPEEAAQPTSEMDLNSDLLGGVALGATAAGVATMLSDEPSIATPTVLEESLEVNSNTGINTDDALGNLDDFSFDTTALDSSTGSSTVAENTVDGIDDITDLSDMDIQIDMPTEVPTTTTVVSPELPTDFDGLSDFDFDLPSDVNEISPTSTEAEAENIITDDGLTQFDNPDIDISIDDLNFDSQDSNTELEAVIDAPTLDAPVVDIQKPTLATHSVDEFVSPVNSSDASIDSDVDYSADFSLLESLNNNQITLDLASQYLDLGEYDSAKRLLAEVMEVGTTEQQQKAQELLEHAS